jgi:hypothetical protein
VLDFLFVSSLIWSALFLNGTNRGAPHYATSSWARRFWTSLVCSFEWNYRHCSSSQITKPQRFGCWICLRCPWRRQEQRICWGVSSLQGLRLASMTGPLAMGLPFSLSTWRRRPMLPPKHKFLIWTMYSVQTSGQDYGYALSSESFQFGSREHVFPLRVSSSETHIAYFTQHSPGVCMEQTHVSVAFG